MLASIGLITGGDSASKNKDSNYDIGNIEQKRDVIVPSCYHLGFVYAKKCKNGATCSFDPVTKFRCRCAKGYSGLLGFLFLAILSSSFMDF